MKALWKCMILALITLNVQSIKINRLIFGQYLRRQFHQSHKVSMDNTAKIDLEVLPSSLRAATGQWQQSSFAVSVPFKTNPSSSCIVTAAIRNRVAPILEEVDIGIAYLQILNSNASLGIGTIDSSPTERSSSLSVGISNGNIHLGKEQEIFLYGLLDTNDRGSICYDFLCTWSGSQPVRVKNEELSDDEVVKEPYGYNGGHTVGQWRPVDEWSAAREAALDTALAALGQSGKELRESEEFFGSSALKAYQTFVRPRPSKAAIHAASSDSIERAAERTAHQVGHLIRRHRADKSTFLRNRDVTIKEYKDRGIKTHPIALVLDNVRSAYNVGGMFRTADTASAAEIVTCGLTPHPNGPGEDKLRKTAFTSIDTVSSRHFTSTVAAVQTLKSEGYRVIAMETTSDATNIFTTDLFPKIRDIGPEADQHRTRQPLALVLGHEVTGVDISVLNICDGIVEIPVYGVKNSLNVCSAATAALYEALRQLKLDDSHTNGTKQSESRNHRDLTISEQKMDNISVPEHNTNEFLEENLRKDVMIERKSIDQKYEKVGDELHASRPDSMEEFRHLEFYAESHSEEEPQLLAELHAKTREIFPQAQHMISGHLQGRLLKTIARISGAQRVLELGTFTGYSALCFAEGGAEVITCELDPRAILIAEEFIRKRILIIFALYEIEVSSQFQGRIKVKQGPAGDTLELLAIDKTPPFDIIYLDSDKLKYIDYFESIMDKGLLKEGGLLITDNVLFKGMVPNLWARTELEFESGKNESSSESETDSEVPTATKQQKRRLRIAKALHKYNLCLCKDERMDVLTLPMRDGISIAVLNKKSTQKL